MNHQSTKTGILLANTGTPNQPRVGAVRQFLAQFLSDQRVIDTPRWLWLPLLHTIILNSRPRHSARLYQRVWTERGSPLLFHTKDLAEKVQNRLNQAGKGRYFVVAGMRYGEPSIRDALQQFQESGMDRIMLLPLFPQFSGPTTGSILSHFFKTLSSWRWIPEVETRSAYFDHPAYLQGLSRHTRAFWDQHGSPDHILFSFHGIPQSYADKGDPYERQCAQSAVLLAESLGISESNWSISYQSRFGPQTWLKPYTEDKLAKLASRGFDRLDVMCPGFAVDCLETLDEIGREGKLLYQEQGGADYRYIPALNASDLHGEALTRIILADRNHNTILTKTARLTD